MINTKVVEILRTFDKETLKRLELFITSPFFNTKKEMVLLIKYLLKFAPNFDNEAKLNRMLVYRKVFPNKRYSRDKIQRIIKALTQLIEQFIAHDAFSKDKINQKRNVLKYYSKQKLPKFFSQEQADLQALLEEKAVKNEQDYFNMYRLAKDNFIFDSNNNLLEVNRYANIEQAINLMEIIYILSNLKLLSHMFSYKTVVKEELELSGIDWILAQVRSERFKEIELINAYYNAVMFLKDQNNEENFQNVKAILKTDKLKTQEEEEKLLFDLVINYCALQINAGKLEYYHELFNLYQIALRKDILYVDGYLFPNTVKNIVTTGLRLNELEWTENFLNDYKHKLNPEHQEDIYNYNMAHVLFYKKEYDKALEYLEEAHYKDTFFKTDAKKLKVKIFYEQDEIRLLDSYIEQFYMANYRNNLVSEKHLETNRNFILLLKQLINLPTSDKEKLKKLRTKMEQTEKVAERLWLTAKINEKLIAK